VREDEWYGLFCQEEIQEYCSMPYKNMLWTAERLRSRAQPAPYDITPDATIYELEGIAKQVFFPNPSAEDLQRNDIRDSMKNNCFGLAQDLQLRCRDWGFPLSEIDIFLK
jgi:hypothetical protein